MGSTVASAMVRAGSICGWKGPSCAPVCMARPASAPIKAQAGAPKATGLVSPKAFNEASK